MGPLWMWGAEPVLRERCWKGNLHAHTLWSDGDDFPEMVADWYKSKGYHFLALSDHNLIQAGEKWVNVSQLPAWVQPLIAPLGAAGNPKP